MDSWFGGKKGTQQLRVVRGTEWELGMVVSYGGSGEKGWRAELELSGRKSLDDHHRAATRQ